MGIAVPVAGVQMPGTRRRGLLVAGVAATAVATAIAAAVAATGAAEHPVWVALARALIVAAPCAVGLYAWQRRPGERFGPLLVAAGGAWFATTLAESGDSVPYTAGRVAGWLVEVLLVYLMLSFPTGRLPGRVDRLLVAAIGLAVLVAFLPRAILAEQFAVPSPYSSCVEHCPANALFLLDREPALVESVLRPLGAALVLVVMVGVVVRLWGRMLSATPLARRMFVPVLAIAVVRAALLGVGLSVRSVDPSAPGLETAAWLLALAIPAIALAFLVGLVRWRIFAASTLQRLAASLPASPDGATLRRSFAAAFDDPDVQLAFPAGAARGDRWVDARGDPVELPGAGSGRAVSMVRDRDREVAALVHDEALRYEPELLRASTAIAAAALGNQRLTAEAGTAMREVRSSRARIAASAERERRRIERDLHDGAQQRLVALRIELELAEDLVRRDPERAARRLHELEGQVDEAIDELRALAHGVYPPVLADRGLVDAISAVARRATIPTRVVAHDVRRYPPEVESAVYFCVLEALQNVLKHAGARRAEVVLDGAAGELRFSVRDDGAGMPNAGSEPGQGLANMRDRVAAVGGELEIGSTPRVGTVVRGRLPTSDHEEAP